METKFDYENLPVRVKTDDEEQIWFAGIDVCNILGYKKSSTTIEKLDDDEKELGYLTDTSGQSRKTWMINEPGLYNLVLSSSKPEAKAFRRWVIHDLLPSVRKAGKYTTEQESNRDQTIKSMLAAIDRKKLRLEDVKTEMYDLKRDLQNSQNQFNEFVRSDSTQLEIPFQKTLNPKLQTS